MSAKPIMVQGTMSNVGKSLIVTGLCRIFKQDGYRVAPFKSQNMALNSFIAENGAEMSRAQAVQAEACGIEPSALMNPVLLKPVSDGGSQVIVLGENRGVMKAVDYYKYKLKLFPEILEAYRKLAEENDIIVVEGAGSPAEINLKSEDIVNMGLAARLRAPVLLAGDIDRGGVFAQLWGTIALLEKSEQDMIKALIVNKFRGSQEILRPGLAMLEEKTGKPIAGVLRYVHADIEDEDSLSARLTSKGSSKPIDVAVVKLPKISNFTDFYPLEATAEIGIRYVNSLGELGRPDMVIIPGTENLRADLEWLKTSGLEAAVVRLAGEGITVFGIGGGLQIMGEDIALPEGAPLKGMGLLAVATSPAAEQKPKNTRLTAEVFGDKAQLEGYEIPLKVASSKGGQESLPGIMRQGDAYGTLLHGFFDAASSRDALIRFLSGKKGINPGTIASFDLKAYKEEQFDKLAAAMREDLDMQFIYKILEEGV